VFGFLLGSLSVLVSALITGGVGPWMPFQMLVIGWIGMASAALPRNRLQKLWRGKAEKWLLAAWGALLGLLFGAVMNLTFWPFLIAGATALPEGQTWQPGAGLGEALARYLAFYLATSLPWDIWLSIGNILFILFIGPPILRLLRRFKQRFFFALK
jgi:energy-coupling factor transport system substrate-specific component